MIATEEWLYVTEDISIIEMDSPMSMPDDITVEGHGDVRACVRTCRLMSKKCAMSALSPHHLPRVLFQASV